MVERFTITAAEQDPWVDADANGQWVRYADCTALEAKLAEKPQEKKSYIDALFKDRGEPSTEAKTNDVVDVTIDSMFVASETSGQKETDKALDLMFGV